MKLRAGKRGLKEYFHMMGMYLRIPIVPTSLIMGAGLMGKRVSDTTNVQGGDYSGDSR